MQNTSSEETEEKSGRDDFWFCKLGKWADFSNAMSKFRDKFHKKF